MVHGYVVHSVLASYYYSTEHIVCMCKQEGGVIARSYDKYRDNATPTLVAYPDLQKRRACLRDNTVYTIIQ